MGQPPKLNYSTVAPERHPARTPLFIALIVIPVLIYFLFELQRAPNRPPQDMSTLLGGSEIRAVRGLMAILGGMWVLCAIVLGLLVWNDRRDPYVPPLGGGRESRNRANPRGI